LSASVGLAVTGLGPALRAIGRGFGNGIFGSIFDGIFGLAPAAVAGPDNPTASATPAATADASNSGMAFDRNAGVRAKAVTAVLRGESIDRLRI
jgi:hypothetical protein